jgi:hypothetical protein
VIPELHTEPSYPAHAGYPVRRGVSILPRRLWNTGSPAGAGHPAGRRPDRLAGDDDRGGGARIHQTCLCHLAALSARAVQEKRPSKIRGRGECRVPNAPAASCALCSRSMHTSIHSGGTGNIRHSPRNGFTAYIALSPGTGLSCPRRFVDHPAKLNASVGAPGPHDFAVRFKRRSSCVAKASTASHPTFVTTRTPLLSRRDGGKNTQFPIFRK